MTDDGSLSALLSKLQSSISSATPTLPTEESIQEPSGGISLLNTKNELFLSYLQNLVFLIIVKLQRCSQDTPNNDEDTRQLDEAVVKRLAELRLYLEKGVKPLEGRLQYEIEKAIRAAENSTSGAQTRKDNKPAKQKSRKSTQRRASNASASSEPSASDSSASGSESDSESDTSSIDAQASRPNTAAMLSKMRSSANAAKDSNPKRVYRPPRVNPTSLPTTDTLNSTIDSSRNPDHRSRPLRSAAVDDYITSEMADNPAAEPSIGATITAGGRKSVSDKERRTDEARRRYEESNFIRLPEESKKDRQKRKRGERGGGGFGETEFGLATLGDGRVGRAVGKRRRV